MVICLQVRVHVLYILVYGFHIKIRVLLLNSLHFLNSILFSFLGLIKSKLVLISNLCSLVRFLFNLFVKILFLFLFMLHIAVFHITIFFFAHLFAFLFVTIFGLALLLAFLFAFPFVWTVLLVHALLIAGFLLSLWHINDYRKGQFR